MVLAPFEKRLIIQTGIDILGDADRFNIEPARIILSAIAYQESDFEYRKQIVGGWAHGLWQFEKGGGVAEVMTRHSTKDLAHKVCKIRMVEPTIEEAYIALEFDDVLAASFARLLLWANPLPIPTDVHRAWTYYRSIWRPGKPYPKRWACDEDKDKDGILDGAWNDAIKLYR